MLYTFLTDVIYELNFLKWGEKLLGNSLRVYQTIEEMKVIKILMKFSNKVIPDLILF